jgi:hypothetical protein
MKVAIAPLILTVAAVTASAPPGGGEPTQSRASFEAAIRTDSTAPLYVLITLVDDKSKSARSVCTTANLLLGAIHREYNLEYDEAGHARAEEIAVSNTTHVFKFSKPDALANIPVHYSPSDLASVRAKLAPLTLSQLREGFSSLGHLHSIYRLENRERHEAYRDATACVLIERGLSPGMGDRSDQLWLAP